MQENRIRNRVSKAVESAFDRTINGDVVKDRNYIQRYEATLKFFYLEIEQYRKLLAEIKAEQRSSKGTSNRS